MSVTSLKIPITTEVLIEVYDFSAMDVKFIALCRVTSCMVETYHCIGQPQCPVIQNRRKIFYNLLLLSITVVDFISEGPNLLTPIL